MQPEKRLDGAGDGVGVARTGSSMKPTMPAWLSCSCCSSGSTELSVRLWLKS